MIVRAAILLACWLAVMWWVFLDNDLVGGEFFVGAAAAVVLPWLWRAAGHRSGPETTKSRPASRPEG